MSMYKKLQELWKRPKDGLKEIQKARLILWRKDKAIVKVDKPTRLDRARALGYKAKKGIIVIRARVARKKRLRPLIKKGRRSKARRRKKIVSKSYRQICEERAARKYSNLEVLNSYFIGKDGQYYFYEVILVDVNNPSIKKDKDLNWICSNKHKGRAFRGLTSAGKKSRGLRKKGNGAEKVRPSLRAHNRKAH